MSRKKFSRIFGPFLTTFNHIWFRHYLIESKELLVSQVEFELPQQFDSVSIYSYRRFRVGRSFQKNLLACKHFVVGDVIRGKSEVVPNPRTEIVEYYETSELKVVERAAESGVLPPPWHGVPPKLEIYGQRGHRRLDPRIYEAKCKSCIWGCRMPVEIIVDHWNPRIHNGSDGGIGENGIHPKLWC